jgi:hypothetical protein
MPGRFLATAILAALLLSCVGASPAAARTIYVNNTYTGSYEDGSLSTPFKTVAAAAAASLDGDVILITSGDYREIVNLTRRVAVQANPGPVTIGQHVWGRLANPDFIGQPIRTTLFFSGMPLDGSGSTDPANPFYNKCGASAGGMWCYSRNPLDNRHLNWIDAANPSSGANRAFVVQSIVDGGFNVISMSSWGEKGLPCTIPCADTAVCIHETRCHRDATGHWVCNIGWFGAANMQMTSESRDQLFDAALGKPILIMPFIESRFGSDWDFHDDFPRAANGLVAPGLVSQIDELVNQYVRFPANPAWPAKWARVFDQTGQERYAVTIVQAASARIDSADVNGDRDFAAGFDLVAQQVWLDTGIRVGFLIDPIARGTPSTFGCLPASDLSKLMSNYGPDPAPAPQRPWFKPDPITTGPELKKQVSILGIQAFSPEGWIDYRPGDALMVNSCFKLAWKQDFSRKWFNTGIPFLQDVSPGYDGHLLFRFRTLPGGLTQWGYDQPWRDGLGQLVADYGQNGMAYNAWNGYCEGLVGLKTKEDAALTPPFPTYNWMRSLTARY